MSAPNEHSFSVDNAQDGARLDHFLSEKIDRYSRSYLKKLIKDGYATVNNETTLRPSQRLNMGNRVSLTIPEPQAVEIKPENIPLDIIYEDESLLVVNKAAGMVVHPGAGIRQGTLVNALMYHCQDLSGIGGRLRPGIVHRLDKNTSGLLVVAKDDRSHVALQKQFAEKTAGRLYQAVVWGNPAEDEGRIDNFIERSKSDRKKFTVASQGKKAITLFKVRERYAWLSLVDIHLKTGRTHQIRVHFSAMHHPVFGDPDYSGRKKQLNRLSSLSERNFAVYLLKIMEYQTLHARTLQFVHPLNNREVSFTAELPKNFQRLLEAIKKHED